MTNAPGFSWANWGPPRRCWVRGVRGEQVTLGEHGLPGDKLRADARRALGGDKRIVCDHSHPKGRSPVRYLTPNFAQPDDTQGLAVQLNPGKLLPLPLPPRR